MNSVKKKVQQTRHTLKFPKTSSAALLTKLFTCSGLSDARRSSIVSPSGLGSSPGCALIRKKKRESKGRSMNFFSKKKNQKWIQ